MITISTLTDACGIANRVARRLWHAAAARPLLDASHDLSGNESVASGAWRARSSSWARRRSARSWASLSADRWNTVPAPGCLRTCADRSEDLGRSRTRRAARATVRSAHACRIYWPRCPVQPERRSCVTWRERRPPVEGAERDRNRVGALPVRRTSMRLLLWQLRGGSRGIRPGTHSLESRCSLVIAHHAADQPLPLNLSSIHLAPLAGSLLR